MAQTLDFHMGPDIEARKAVEAPKSGVTTKPLKPTHKPQLEFASSPEA